MPLGVIVVPLRASSARALALSDAVAEGWVASQASFEFE
jgi:hypothetical protein